MSDDTQIGRIEFGPRLTRVGAGDGQTFIVDTGWYEREIKRLEAELAALRADADRMDWLELQQDVGWQDFSGNWHTADGGSIRWRIDLARKEAP